MERSPVQEKISAFRRKYYLQLFVGGLTISFVLLIAYLLIAAFLEYSLWLPGWLRFTLVALFVVTLAICLLQFLGKPLKFWLWKKGLSEEETARFIGSRSTAIGDYLLNYVQIKKKAFGNQLAEASLLQRENQLMPIPFDQVISWKDSKRNFLLLGLLMLVCTLILFFKPEVLTSSTDRILHFQTQYSPQAPFQFNVDIPEGAIYNEDYTIEVKLKGTAIPEKVLILRNGYRFPMHRTEAGFTYVVENVLQPFSFQVEAGGFFSPEYQVNLLNRPELALFKLKQTFPTYLKRAPEEITNQGTLEVPEGTQLTWEISAPFTDSAFILLDSVKSSMQPDDNQSFTYSTRAKSTFNYELILKNSKLRNKHAIQHEIRVIKDQYPSVQVSQYRDSVTYQKIFFSGIAIDDYGISGLRLHYKLKKSTNLLRESSRVIPVGKEPKNTFVYVWALDSLALEPGQVLEYYLEVQDNDGIHGFKTSRTGLYTFQLPTRQQLENEIVKSERATSSGVDESLQKARKLQSDMEKLTQDLKGRQELEWKDRQALEEIIQEKNELDNLVRQLSEQHKTLEEKRNVFSEEDQRIAERAKQLQRLLDELLDEETRKLLAELSQLMKENSDVKKIKEVMDKLNRNSQNFEKELERALEHLKNELYESHLERLSNELKELAQQQEELSQRSEQLEKNRKKLDKEEFQEQSKELLQEQEELKAKFEELEERSESVREEGKEIQRGSEVPSSESEKSVEKSLDESLKELENQQPGKAQPSQKKSAQQMQQMSQDIASNMESAEMEMDMENLEQLRQIVHGLVTVSYQQEAVIREFSRLNGSDPRFNTLAQRQLQLQEDVKVIEDSLLALGKRDPFMGAVIGKEVGSLQEHLNRANENTRDRKQGEALAEMKASMTSLNNLALMLDNHFDSMMAMMQQAKPGKGKGKKGQQPNLSDLQRNLNQRIEELKNSGKSGREFSEELAQMAAEQERIREALEQMEKEGGSNPGNDLSKRMEQTETDLVNKRLTDELIKRQQQILTRLLDSEKAAKEQDQDDERKGETAKDYEKELPRQFKEYLLLKEKEVELLKTLPPKFYPYFRKEVNDYFNRMSAVPKL